MNFNWVAENEALLWWAMALSVATFIGTLVAIPILLARMPADYFVTERERHWRQRWPNRQRPSVHLLLVGLKNLLGLVLVLMGLGMLVLPGQGLLTLLIGLTLVDFPGKRRVERWFIRRPAIHQAVNWLRRKWNKPPLRVPPPDPAPKPPPRDESSR